MCFDEKGNFAIICQGSASIEYGVGARQFLLVALLQQPGLPSTMLSFRAMVPHHLLGLLETKSGLILFSSALSFSLSQDLLVR